MKIFVRLFTAVAAFSACTAALASPCDQVLSSYSCYPSSVVENHPECFGGSTETSSASTKQSSTATNSAITSALANRFRSDPTQIGGMALHGVAAATPGKRWNMWANLTHNDTEHAYTNAAGNNVKNGNDALTTVVGGDYALSPKMALGVAASFDRASGVSYNDGNPSNSLTNKGYMIAPYIGYSLSREMSIDASLGFGQGELTQTGNTSANADRWYGGVNLNYASWLGKTQISGKLGYQHAEEKYGRTKLANGTLVNGTDSVNKIEQLRLGVQAGWWMNGWMPYVGLAYASDIRRTSSLQGVKDYIGKDAFVWNVGANFFSLASGVTGGIVYNHETGRKNADNHQLVANISLRF